MVIMLHSRLSSGVLSLDWGHCDVFLGETHNASLYPGVKMSTYKIQYWY